MRLIDADALYMNLVKMKDFGELTAKKAIRAVENAPTIDAIPIEWIMRYSFDGERQHPISITKMIADWREENCKND